MTQFLRKLLQLKDQDSLVPLCLFPFLPKAPALNSCQPRPELIAMPFSETWQFMYCQSSFCPGPDQLVSELFQVAFLKTPHPGFFDLLVPACWAAHTEETPNPPRALPRSALAAPMSFSSTTPSRRPGDSGSRLPHTPEAHHVPSTIQAQASSVVQGTAAARIAIGRTGGLA